MKVILFIVLCVILITPYDCYAFSGEKIPDPLNKIMTIYNRGIDRLEKQENEKAFTDFQQVLEAAKGMNDTDSLKIKAAAANNIGNILLLKGNPGEAEAYFRQAVSFDPSHAMAFNNLGSAFLKQGRLEEALKTFQQAIDVDPSSATAYSNLGTIFLELGMLRKAAEFNLATLRLDPTNKKSFLNLIRIYDLSNLPEDRQDTWETLIRVVGNDPDELANIIAMLIDQGSLEQAAKSLPDLIKQFPENSELKIQQARLLILKKQWSKARDILKHLIKQYPENPQVSGYMAVALLNQNELREAEKMAEESVQKFKNNGQTWYIYGAILEKEKKNNEAKKAYLQAIDKDPDNAQALNNLGVLAAKQNQAKEALTYFEKALMAAPFYEEARYNLGRALVITKTDYRRGVLMLTQVGAKPGPAGERARQFIADLETIAAGGDPGWGKESQTMSSLPN